MPVYFFGGVNGVGKTTIIREISTQRQCFEVKHTSSMFMEWLGLEPGDYNTLRRLPSDYKAEKNNEMLSYYLQSLNPLDNVILDSHYLTLINGTVTTIVSGNWLQWVSALVLVDARTENIYKRLCNDNRYRERSLFPDNSQANEQIALLQDYRKRTHDEFSKLAVQFKLPKMILNNESDLGVPVSAFLQFTENVTG